MTLLGVKTCGESEFDIFEAKKRFPDSRKACVSKRKVAKCDFYLKTTLFKVKMCGESEFDSDSGKAVYRRESSRKSIVNWIKSLVLQKVYICKKRCF
jgi:hypothetical protein